MSDHDGQSPENAVPPVRQAAADPASEDLTVLLVDRDEAIHSAVREFFAEAYPSVTVVTETDGMEAYQYVRSRPVDCLVVEHRVPEIEWGWLAKAADCEVVLYTDTDPADIGDEVIAAADTFVQKRDVAESRRFLARKVVGATTAEPEGPETTAAAAVAETIGEEPGAFLVDAEDTVLWRSRPFADLFPVEVLDISIPETDALDVRLAALFDNDPAMMRDVLGGSGEEATVFGVPVGGPTWFYRHHSYAVEAADAVARMEVFEPLTDAVEAFDQYELLEHLVENAQDGLYVIDADAEFVYCNRTYAEMFGYEPEELVGHHCSKVLAPGELERGQEVVDRLWQSDADSEVIDQEFVTKEGERVHGSVHFSIRTRDGEYAGLMGVVRELSSGTRTHLDVARFRTIVRAAPVPMCLLDDDGVVEVCNDPLAALFDADRHDIEGRDVRQILPARAAEDSDEVARRLRTATEVGADRFPLRLDVDDGPEEATVELSAVGGDRHAFAGHLLTILTGDEGRHA